jgi:hypothetical protein
MLLGVATPAEERAERAQTPLIAKEKYHKPRATVTRGKVRCLHFVDIVLTGTE